MGLRLPGQVALSETDLGLLCKKHGLGEENGKSRTIVVLQAPFSACKLEIRADKLYDGVEKSIHFY